MSSHRLAWLAAALTVVGAVGCGAAEQPLPRGRAPVRDELVLYRDRALMKQRITVVVPEAAKATVTFMVPAGIRADDVTVLDVGQLTVSKITTPLGAHPPTSDAMATGPTSIMFEVTAPHAGTYTLTVAPTASGGPPRTR